MAMTWFGPAPSPDCAELMGLSPVGLYGSVMVFDATCQSLFRSEKCAACDRAGSAGTSAAWRGWLPSVSLSSSAVFARVSASRDAWMMLFNNRACCQGHDGPRSCHDLRKARFSMTKEKDECYVLVLVLEPMCFGVLCVTACFLEKSVRACVC